MAIMGDKDILEGLPDIYIFKVIISRKYIFGKSPFFCNLEVEMFLWILFVVRNFCCPLNDIGDKVDISIT